MSPGVSVSHHLRVIIHAMYRRCFVNQIQERGVVYCSDLFSAEANILVETNNLNDIRPSIQMQRGI